MVIFHSYVSFLEGNHDAFPIQTWDFPVTGTKNHHVGISSMPRETINLAIILEIEPGKPIGKWRV